MTTETYVDGSEIRSWRSVGNEWVALLRYDHSTSLDKSSLTLRSDGGVCVFASPPFYTDPDVIAVRNWNREVPDLVQRQGSRHAFIGEKDKVDKLGLSPT